MDSEADDVVVPVLKEELKADAIPVETGGVRVTKKVHTHDEIVEQELRTGRVEVKRVQVNRPVDGPVPVRRSGNTLIVPVVSEEIRVERHWVLTEEIHLTHVEEVQTVQQTIPVNEERASIERLDSEGSVVEDIAQEPSGTREKPTGILKKRAAKTGSERVLSDPRSILRQRSDRDKGR